VNIAALQLSTLPMSKAKLDYYMMICKKRGVSLVLLGEYNLNSFFKELESMSKMMIKEQSKHKISILKELAKEYDTTIVAPIITFKKDKIYKSIGRFTPRSTHYHNQQYLINFKHWNEEKFFDNELERDYTPMIFNLEGFKIAALNGFELHFDPIWLDILKKKVDLVLLPTASTFGSRQRWAELIKARAFLNGVYILRANRIGEYQDKDVSWKFYGESFLALPNGELQYMLGHKEEMLLAEVDKSIPRRAKRDWGFAAQIRKREEL
jgi:nitrilase